MIVDFFIVVFLFQRKSEDSNYSALILVTTIFMLRELCFLISLLVLKLSSMKRKIHLYCLVRDRLKPLLLAANISSGNNYIKFICQFYLFNTKNCKKIEIFFENKTFLLKCFNTISFKVIVLKFLKTTFFVCFFASVNVKFKAISERKEQSCPSLESARCTVFAGQTGTVQCPARGCRQPQPKSLRSRKLRHRI